MPSPHWHHLSITTYEIAKRVSMKLTTRSRYGTRMLLDIALHSTVQPVPIKEIATRQDLPVKYLEQIIRTLRTAGYITSTRGSRGGYTLAMSPEEILIGDIAYALEEAEICLDCGRKSPCCQRVAVCLARTIWEDASRAMYRKLNTFTLADLIKDAELCPKTQVMQKAS